MRFVDSYHASHLPLSTGRGPGDTLSAFHIVVLLTTASPLMDISQTYSTLPILCCISSVSLHRAHFDHHSAHNPLVGSHFTLSFHRSRLPRRPIDVHRYCIRPSPSPPSFSVARFPSSCSPPPSSSPSLSRLMKGPSPAH